MVDFKYENENIVAKSSTLVQKEIVDIVEKYHNDFDMMIHVLMSSGMSAASFKVAENVRKQFENVIPHNIDSRQAINGVGNVPVSNHRHHESQSHFESGRNRSKGPGSSGKHLQLFCFTRSEIFV